MWIVEAWHFMTSCFIRKKFRVYQIPWTFVILYVLYSVWCSVALDLLDVYQES